MKISVSLPSDDVRFLDRQARSLGAGSRSAVVQRAIRLMRAAELGPDYAGAWDEWAAEGEAAAWEAVVGDGVGPVR
jgi:Arc/MetJ-type ribon-helix-helix transcriptional regulator